MSIDGEVTTYTLDYANKGQILLEQGGAFAQTKHYLYGLSCIGELVDAGDPETEEWRYYQRDGNNLVRQTTNSAAEITLAWAYSPDGAVLIGAKGPVTNLGCGDIYDWSTGLVYKNGRYFDPNLGIWLTLAPFVVWQKYKLGKRGGKSRRKRRSREQLFLALLFLLVVALALVGCDPNAQLNPTEIPDCPPTLTPDPTGTPTPTQPPGLPPNTPTPIPTIPPRPPTPAEMPTPTIAPHPWTRFKLSNPFKSESYLVVEPYGSSFGEPRPRTGSHGHYGIDLVTEQYVIASHGNPYEESGTRYYSPSTQGAKVVAPTTGTIIRNSGETVIIRSDSVEGIEVELTHVKTGPGVISAGILETNYSNGASPYGPLAIHPHLHLTVTFTDENNVTRDLDPRPMLPEWGHRFYAGNSSDPGVYFNDGTRTGIQDLPKYPQPQP